MSRARPPLLLGIRLLRMLWRVLLPAAIAAQLLLGPWLLGAEPALAAQAARIALFLGVAAVANALVQELLSPKRSQMRWIPVPDHRAERLAAISKSLIYVLFVTESLIYLVRANQWSEAVASLLGLLRNVGLIALGAAALQRSGLLRRLRSKGTERLSGLLRALVVRVGFPLLVAAALAWTVAQALGYQRLAAFLAAHAGGTFLAVAAVALVHRWLVSRVRSLVHFMQAEGGAKDAEPRPALIGLETVARGVLKVAALAGGLLAVLGVWGVGAAEFVAALDTPILGAGGLRWGGVLEGVLHVGVVLLVGWLLKTVLVFFLFPGSRLDMGARYAVLTLLRYVVYLLAVLIGLNALGVDGSALAVFAGAATVGLAFGLQDIFANFFSGLIMLVERPLRVGDLVDINGAVGTVEAIRLRGTTLRTIDQTVITIPNRQIIGERLTNLTYGLQHVRVVVEVGVAYDSDPRQVARVLEEVVRNDPRFLTDPGPVVRLMNFGASSLDFLLMAFTRQVGDRFQIQAELRIAVLEAFRRHGIEIPFPQQDVYVRRLPPPAGA